LADSSASPATTDGGAALRLLIVDDHPVVREGLRGMFEADPQFEVVGDAGNGAEAVTVAEELRPDVILMDLRMPGTDGLTAIRQLRERRLPARVLVLTTYDSERDVVPAIQAGAIGYLLKDAPRGELVRAVLAAGRGETVLSPTAATRLVGEVRAPAKVSLSQRELEVLTLIARGRTNKEVGAALYISEATVKSHLLHLYGKLGVNDRAAAVAAAFKADLLKLSPDQD
jgi:DNA-binding NarL/FixJ family response regulator